MRGMEYLFKLKRLTKPACSLVINLQIWFLTLKLNRTNYTLLAAFRRLSLKVLLKLKTTPRRVLVFFTFIYSSYDSRPVVAKMIPFQGIFGGKCEYNVFQCNLSDTRSHTWFSTLQTLTNEINKFIFRLLYTILMTDIAQRSVDQTSFLFPSKTCFCTSFTEHTFKSSFLIPDFIK